MPEMEYSELAKPGPSALSDIPITVTPDPEFRYLGAVSVNDSRGFSFSNSCEYRLDEFRTITPAAVDHGQECESVPCRPGEIPIAGIERRADEPTTPASLENNLASVERAINILVAIKQYVLTVKRLILKFHRGLLL